MISIVTINGIIINGAPSGKNKLKNFKEDKILLKLNHINIAKYITFWIANKERTLISFILSGKYVKEPILEIHWI